MELKRYRAAKANTVKDDDDDNYSYANKNEYSNTVPWNYGYEFDDLARYIAIMATIYNVDTKAKGIVDYAWNSNDKSLIFTSALSLHKNKQLQNDTIWNWLAADKKFRMHLLDWLEITKDTALYPSDYYSPELMAESWLQAIPYSKEEKDSINFIKKIKLTDAFNEGYVFFYRYKDDDEWKLNYVGFQPSDTTKMVSDFKHYQKKGIVLDDLKEKTITKAIDDAIKEVELFGRRRVSNSYRGAYDDYFYD
ncbi:MAG: hypothetical protein MI922_25960 [Bacteroidales bacterium]|nr:hypothetical protein [Bacteroidales bacterium]